MRTTKKNTGRIRDREQPKIPHIKLGITKVRQEHANLDKIELTIKKAFRVSFHANQVDLFMKRLGSSDVFCRKGMGRTLKTRQSKLIKELWLFGAKLRFYKDPTSMGGNQLLLNLDLTLNPTRFINHVTFERDFRDFQSLKRYISKSSPGDILQGNIELSRSRYSLDEKTNLLPRNEYRKLRPATEIFQLYLEKVIQLVELEIFNALKTSSRSFDNRSLTRLLENWFINHAEVYWEFSSHNALAYVQNFHEQYLPLLNETQLSYFDLDCEKLSKQQTLKGSYNVTNNALSSRLRIGSHLDLIVYCKEINRLRFELQYKSNLATILGTSKSALEENALGCTDLLEKLISYSSKKMAKVFAWGPDIPPPDENPLFVALELLTTIQLTAERHNLVGSLKEILGEILVNRSIWARNGTPEASFCEDLSELKILRVAKLARNSDGTRRYAVAAKYIQVLMTLKESRI